MVIKLDNTRIFDKSFEKINSLNCRVGISNSDFKLLKLEIPFDSQCKCRSNQ